MNIANMMKRIILFILTAVGTLTISAQTQQGYVKTLGRPNQKGVALSGVSIRVKGGHNAVLSDAKGFFSMMLSGKKEGDAYALQQVQKQGYELNERGIIGRQYAFSEKVPLTIVMVSTKQLQADKQRIENNAYKTAEKNYKTQMALLEKQQQANQITIEKYHQETQELKNSFEKYQSLIDGLADHYAHTDYDELDAKEQEINLCIENGDLDKAELLLHALDIEKRLAEIEQRIKAGQQLKEEALEDQRKIQKQQEKDAEYLYQLYTIALGRFDNEKARYYIETRAALDSTNAEWQFDAGYYLAKQNLHQKAIVYYKRVLKMLRKQAQENPQIYEPDVVTTLNNLALLYRDIQQFSESETMCMEALDICRRLANSNPQDYEPDVAMTLNNLALLYRDFQQFAESEAMYKEALKIYRRLANSNPQNYEPIVALTLNNLAELYSKTQRFSESEAMYKEVLEIRRRLASSNPQAHEPYVAATLNNLANLYSDTQHYTESEAMFKDALEIYSRLVSSNPQAYEPNMAMTLNNLAALYSDTQRYEESETMYKDALEIRRRLAQSNPQAYEPDMAATLNNLAALYNDTQRYAESEEMYKDALEIYCRLATSNPLAYEPYVAAMLNNLAGLYYDTQRYAESEEMYKDALEIRHRLAQSNPQAYEPDMAATQYNLANLYSDTQRYGESEAMFKDALEIRRRLATSNPQAYEPNLAATSLNYGLLNLKQKKYAEAIPMFEIALNIYRRLAQNNPVQQEFYEISLYSLSMLYLAVDNYTSACQINQEWLPVLKKKYEEDKDGLRKDYAEALGNQSFYVLFMKKYTEAERYAREGLMVDSTMHWIVSNLASALLFQGKYAEAEILYRQYKDELREGVLEDFKRFAEAEIIPKKYEADVEKIKKMLNE